MGNIDDKQFQQLAQKLEGKKKARELIKNVVNQTNRMKYQVQGNVKKLTPVDTGTLRRSWRTSSVQITNDHIFFVVSNVTEYASFLEYGHRTKSGGWVNGNFMLRDILKSFYRDMYKNYGRELDKYLKELFS